MIRNVRVSEERRLTASLRDMASRGAVTVTVTVTGDGRATGGCWNVCEEWRRLEAA